VTLPADNRSGKGIEVRPDPVGQMRFITVFGMSPSRTKVAGAGRQLGPIGVKRSFSINRERQGVPTALASLAIDFSVN
jgi:hypothetical protein